MSVHFVTVGTWPVLVETLWERIARVGQFQFSHVVEPGSSRHTWKNGEPPPNVYFIADVPIPRMPKPDIELLSSLECDGVPSVHNMILSDRIVSKLDYAEALGYCTFLVQRLATLYKKLRPTVIIGSFDALHGGLGLAVARSLNIPWFALNFSVIPAGLASFCDGMSPTARVMLDTRQLWDVAAAAESALESFLTRKVHAPAYIAPKSRGLAGSIGRLPARVAKAFWMLRIARHRRYLKFVREPGGYDLCAAVRRIYRLAAANAALGKMHLIEEPPAGPYVLFGLHTQPESSIDVWAPFYSNQLWVIELLARSIPPSHGLLVKVHKSDVSNYSREQLEHMRSFPGVQLVAPFADTRKLIENAALLFSIQGTMGLEAALLGKPLITLGESPVACFPSVSPIGRLVDLPKLVRRKLTETAPSRKQILDAYQEYLRPFAPASYNDWTKKPDEREIVAFSRLFEALASHVRPTGSTPLGQSAG
ncbi:MAG TPA: hypothetical protein VND80_08725 [Steroidobacteraceae bacterium]|nr:hypothetical protein [Steroidobacteraceae bacterium]